MLVRHTLLGLVLASTTCCSGSTFLQRTGPEFRVAFPDAGVLVTTTDPASVRQQLANTQLPATEAHHQRLLELLRAQQTISAPHLVLLVEAVSLPENTMVVVDGSTRHTYAPRGEGTFAPIADQLLREGADKLVGLDRRWCGELIGRTQTDATLQVLTERFVPGLDDGSEGALREILSGMPGSPATGPFLRILASTGRLDGERGWAVVGMVSFDHERSALIALLAARQPKVDAARLVAMVKLMSFDDGRQDVVRLLAPNARPVPITAVRDVLAAFSFDDGRAAACAVLASQDSASCDLAQVADLARTFSFDDGRLRCVRAMGGRIRGQAQVEDAHAVMRSFSFDDNRLAALRVLATHCRDLSRADKKRLVDSFSFAASRDVAAALLN